MSARREKTRGGRERDAGLSFGTTAAGARRVDFSRRQKLRFLMMMMMMMRVAPRWVLFDDNNENARRLESRDEQRVRRVPGYSRSRPRRMSVTKMTMTTSTKKCLLERRVSHGSDHFVRPKHLWRFWIPILGTVQGESDGDERRVGGPIYRARVPTV